MVCILVLLFLFWSSKFEIMRSLALFFLIFLSSISYGHDYYFAFGEVEYNDVTQKFETTLIVSTHDLEMILEKKEISSVKIDQISEGSQDYANLASYLTSHFIIKTGSERCSFNLIGMETLLNGTTNFYFESLPVELSGELSFRFDLFMDFYKQQQNKITFHYRDNTYTFPFLITEPTQKLKLENN